ncbi:DegT/DnrJ/EryC1/StrS family aminotransferase [Muricoccus radiodurans]|uniref:DegT/DnrJ/EryC1/StrS family aminotransferase n=1 Tax=Muricoccus radiodurans TaxID=2231721 RepID=UPI003CE6B315
MPDGFWPPQRPPIPVARPLLPRAEALLPYLQEMDAARCYSNFGPLSRRLERRLAEQYGIAAGSVVTVANATLGLTLALQAQRPRPGSLCLMPAWTFAASAHAAVLVGLRPHFLDVGEDGALTPGAVERALASLPPGRVGAVMAVAPFGRPLEAAAWDALAARTGLPMVLDAAAGFDGLVPGRVPAVVSLHATKILGAGEGGFVVSSDPAVLREVERRSNFGFAGGRNARVTAMNAKMSEYAAAVALAGLDAWPDTRARLAGAAAAYRRALRGVPGAALQEGFGTRWLSATAVVSLRGAPPLDALEEALAAEGIATRRWWPRGLHEEEAFSGFGHEALPVTARLSATTLGLPFFTDMNLAEVERVGTALRRALGAHAPFALSA